MRCINSGSFVVVTILPSNAIALLSLLNVRSISLFRGAAGLYIVFVLVSASVFVRKCTCACCVMLL